MKLFSVKAFLYTFGIVSSMSFSIGLSVLATQGAITTPSVIVVVLASLGTSSVISTLIASYKLPLRWARWVYRSVMRRLAKRAIRSSLSQAMTPVSCLGIMETGGYVYLRLGIGSADGIRERFPFQLFESTANQLWGILEVVTVEENQCDCVPVIRVNEEFWTALENRMRSDTSPPPNVHLVVGLPPPIMKELSDWLLDNWR